jgi:hypothetical protein
MHTLSLDMPPPLSAELQLDTSIPFLTRSITFSVSGVSFQQSHRTAVTQDNCQVKGTEASPEKSLSMKSKLDLKNEFAPDVSYKY